MPITKVNKIYINSQNNEKYERIGTTNHGYIVAINCRSGYLCHWKLEGWKQFFTECKEPVVQYLYCNVDLERTNNSWHIIRLESHNAKATFTDGKLTKVEMI